MMHKLAAVIGGVAGGGGGSGVPLSAPAPHPIGLVLSPPVAAGARSASYSEHRAFGVVLKHQFDAVNSQVEHGLLHVKRTVLFVETVLRCLEHSGDARKQTAELTARWQLEPLQDEMHHYVHAGAMIGEMMLHTFTAHEQFRRSVAAECSALFAFYKSAQARRRELTKEHARMLSAWTVVEEALTKERRECAKAYADLRLAQDAKDRSADESPDCVSDPRLVRRWKSQKDATVKKFQSFERAFEKAKSLQESNDAVVLPAMLGELEAIERDRLHNLTEAMHGFQKTFSSWSADLKTSSDIISKVVPALEAEKSVTTMIDKFSTAFGPPPPLEPIRYDLPCTSTTLAGDGLLPSENEPLLAYPVGLVPLPAVPTTAPTSLASRALSALSALSSATSVAPTPPPAAAAAAAVAPPPTSTATPPRVQPPPIPSTLVARSTSTSEVPRTTRSSSIVGPPPLPVSSTTTAAAATPATATGTTTAATDSSSTSSVPTTATTSSNPPPLSAPSSLPPVVAAAAPANATIASSVPATLGVFTKNSRAPPPSLPQKRKPKTGDGANADAPALPSLMTASSAAFRAAASQRQSLPRSSSLSGSAPGLPPANESLSLQAQAPVAPPPVVAPTPATATTTTTPAEAGTTQTVTEETEAEPSTPTVRGDSVSSERVSEPAEQTEPSEPIKPTEQTEQTEPTTEAPPAVLEVRVESAPVVAAAAAAGDVDAAVAADNNAAEDEANLSAAEKLARERKRMSIFGVSLDQDALARLLPPRPSASLDSSRTSSRVSSPRSSIAPSPASSPSPPRSTRSSICEPPPPVSERLSVWEAPPPTGDRASIWEPPPPPPPRPAADSVSEPPPPPSVPAAAAISELVVEETDIDPLEAAIRAKVAPVAAVAATSTADSAASATTEGAAVDETVVETNVQHAIALYDFQLDEDTADIHYLTFSAGDAILVYHTDDEWWYGEANGDAGFFAGNYVELTGVEDANGDEAEESTP